MNISTLVRADLLFLAELFISREETRYYLNGVCIEKSEEAGVLLISTDGHRIAAVRDALGATSVQRIVRVPPLLRTIWKEIPPYRREACWFALICDDDLSCGQCEGRLFDATKHEPDDLEDVRRRIRDLTSSDMIWAGGIELISGKFVDWRRVVPPSVNAGFAPHFLQEHYIRDFLKVAEIAGDGAVKFIFNSAAPGAPAFIDCGRADFFGLLMPMKNIAGSLEQSASEFIAPSWLGLPAPKNLPETE